MKIHGGDKVAVVLSPDASEAERQGAGELVSYLSRSVSANASIVAAADAHCAIYIGSAAIGLPAYEKFAAARDGLGKEGTFIATDGNLCLLCGNTPRAILYSIYSFLEDFLGIRWFTESLTIVPKATEVAIPDGVRTFVPKLSFRHSSFKDGMDHAYCAHNKLNAEFIPLGSQYGGGESFVPGGFAHTLSSIVPPELFDSHPEYFPLINGERVNGPCRQRCLTNPDVRRMAREWTRKMLAEHPDSNIISVSQNDTYPDDPGVCTCPRCKEINDREGSLSGTMIDLVNDVADSIREDFPDKLVETLAYRFSRKAPKTLVPRDNVLVRLCSIECCFSHPIRDCDSDSGSFLADLRDWARISKQLFVWDYVTNFACYLLPHPNLRLLQDNVRLFEENKAIGYLPLGAYDSHGAEMSELRSYLISKLEWDSEFDCEKGTREFMAAFCGKGAPYVLEYIDLLHDRVASEHVHWSTYEQPDSKFFTREFLDEAGALFAKALAAENDAETVRRIRKLEMSIRFTRLWLYPDEYASSEEFGDAVDRFTAEMHELGVDKYSEWPRQIEKFVAAIKIRYGESSR